MSDASSVLLWKQIVTENFGARSCPTLCDPQRTVAYQAPLSMGFSRQEYWSGLLFPAPGDLPDPGIKPGSPALQTDALPPKPPGKPHNGNGVYQTSVQMMGSFTKT